MTAAAIVTVCALCGPTAAAVYAHHLAHGVSTQARVAADCGLARQTVALAVATLEAKGVATVARGVIVACKEIEHSVSFSNQKHEILTLVRNPNIALEILTKGEEIEHSVRNPNIGADASRAHIHASTHADAHTLARRKRGDEPNAANCDENSHDPKDIQRESLDSQPTASAEQGYRVDLKNAPAHEPTHTHAHEGGDGGSLPLPELSAPSVARPEPKKRAEPKQPTCASEVMRIFKARYHREKGCAPTMLRGHVMQLQRLAKEHDPRIAALIVDGFEADDWAQKTGGTFALLVSASVWDRSVSSAYNRASFLLPMPDPATCSAQDLATYQSRFPERVRLQIDSWRQDYVMDAGGAHTDLPTPKIYAKMIAAAVKEGLAQGWF